MRFLHAADIHLGNQQYNLTDPVRRKHHVGGQLYAVHRAELMDIMRRYEVAHIES